MNYLSIAKELLKQKSEHLFEQKIDISIKGLSVQQAIGKPKRQDYPIIQGKEIMIQAEFMGSIGQAFTECPVDFKGKIRDIFNLSLQDERSRAPFIASLNAIACHLKIASGTIHCKDEDPEMCGEKIVSNLKHKYTKIGLIGLNPALLEHLSKYFSNILATDLSPDSIGAKQFGVEIKDGNVYNKLLIKNSDFVLFTGSTLCNGAFDTIMNTIKNHNKDYAIFGTTSAGICALLKLNRFCDFSI